MEQSTTSPGNVEEAGYANIEGKKLLRMGQFAKAVKLFEISLRMVENTDVRQNLSSAKAALARESTNSNSNSNSNSTQAGAEQRPPPSPSAMQTLLMGNSFVKAVIDAESRFVAPTARIYVRGMGIIILSLLCWKFIFRRSLSLGYLPGDLKISGLNMSFHAPIASCLLISFLGNALLRAFNR